METTREIREQIFVSLEEFKAMLASCGKILPEDAISYMRYDYDTNSVVLTSVRQITEQ